MFSVDYILKTSAGSDFLLVSMIKAACIHPAIARRIERLYLGEGAESQKKWKHLAAPQLGFAGERVCGVPSEIFTMA